MRKGKVLIVISIIFLSFFLVSVHAADTLSKYEEQLEAVKKQQKENAEKLTGVEKELALYAYDVAEIDSEMLAYSKKNADIQNKIDDVQDTLDKLDEKLKDANENYGIVNSTYVNRLRQMYENGIPSIFEIIVTANGFRDLMVKLNLYSMILEHDRTLMNSYQDKQNYVNYIRGDIELKKKSLESLKTEMNEVKSELEEKRSKKQERIQELQNKSNELEETAKLLTQRKKDAISDIDNEIARIVEELAEQIRNGTVSSFTGTEFVYPTPGFTTITTSFGEIYNLVDPNGSAHTGTDIAGENINCTPIFAIQAGLVTTAGYSNYGYGNYIIINHGECVDNNTTYISLYGHCSSLVVERGDTVKKGQLIGYVGTTGNSTGPHLHLEVRENGERVNPLKLFPGISFNVL